MKQKIIQQGAEATISLIDNNIHKNRIKKSYRLQVLDQKLRKRRTKSETKIISKLNNVIPTPKIIESDNKEKIVMENIIGKKLSENLEKLDYKIIAKLIANNLTKMHDNDIIHGDLTTSNMIYTKEKNLVYFIDFGLSFHSYKIEDKAVDLRLLRQALSAKHFTIANETYKIILKNYKAKDHEKIIKRIDAIEKRGRYKGH